MVCSLVILYVQSCFVEPKTMYEDIDLEVMHTPCVCFFMKEAPPPLMGTGRGGGV